MPSRSALLSASVLALSSMTALVARAESQVSDQVDAVVIVARDKAGLLEKQPSQTIFGIAKPLIETPRSASLVSDMTLERYGVLTLDGVDQGLAQGPTRPASTACPARSTFAAPWPRTTSGASSGWRTAAPIPPRSAAPRASRSCAARRPRSTAPARSAAWSTSSPSRPATKDASSPNRKARSPPPSAATTRRTSPASSARRSAWAGPKAGLRLWRGRGQPQLLQRPLSAHQALEVSSDFDLEQRLEHGLRRHGLPLDRRCADAGLEPPDPGPDRQPDLHHRPRHDAWSTPTATAS
jgi:hypothetical protein